MMALARLLEFDLWARRKELTQRHLYVPRGTGIPPAIATVFEANVDTALFDKYWDTMVHLAASLMSGNASAVAILAKFGSAARNRPVLRVGKTNSPSLRGAKFVSDRSALVSG